MPSILKTGSRRYVALAFAAALAGAAVSTAPASAGTQDAEFACDPSFELCNIKYHYYSSSAKTTQVGYAEDPCEGPYGMVWGSQTRYVTVHSFYCPF